MLAALSMKNKNKRVYWGTFWISIAAGSAIQLVTQTPFVSHIFMMTFLWPGLYMVLTPRPVSDKALAETIASS